MNGLPLDTLEPVQLGGITQWIRFAARPVQPGAAAHAAGSRAADHQRGARVRAAVSGWRRTSRSSTGTSGAPACRRRRCASSNTVEISAAPHGRRHGVDAGAAARPLRRQDLRRRVLLRRDVRRTGRRAPPRSRRGAGGNRHGHRHPAARRRHTYDFVLSTARKRGNRRAIRQLEKIGPPPHLDAKQFATRARWAANFGGVTANATFNSLLRDAARQPAPLAGLLDRRRHPHRARHHRLTGRAAARSSPPRTWCAPCPASTCPSSWHRAASTRWHPAKPRSGSTTH